jgi:hypothetical protein
MEYFILDNIGYFSYFVRQHEKRSRRCAGGRDTAMARQNKERRFVTAAVALSPNRERMVQSGGGGYKPPLLEKRRRRTTSTASFQPSPAGPGPSDLIRLDPTESESPHDDK